MIENKHNDFKEYLKIFVIIILVITCLVALAFGIGKTQNFFKSTIHKESVDIDREIFETSKSYIKGMADDLAKYKYDYETTESDSEKQAIRNVIVSRFADFDANKLSNSNLRSFLLKMRGY